jgi:hypothetical protein
VNEFPTSSAWNQIDDGAGHGREVDTIRQYMLVQDQCLKLVGVKVEFCLARIGIANMVGIGQALPNRRHEIRVHKKRLNISTITMPTARFCSKLSVVILLS